MNSIEKPNINTVEQLENKLREILIKKGRFEKYPSTKINYIKDGIFAISSTNNISLYMNGTGEVIFNIGVIGKLPLFKSYCEIILIEEIKNEKGEYEMFKIEEGGEQRKLDKYSIEYFEIWETISFLHSRDLLLHILEGNSKKTVMKIEDKLLDIMVDEGVIRLIDLTIFLSKGNLTHEQFKKYHKPVMNLLLDQIGDERFSLLPNNKQYQLSTKEGSFQISTGKVTKEELNYLLSAKLLSPEIHQLAIEKIDELEKLEAEKNTELKKDLDKLENEIRDTK